MLRVRRGFYCDRVVSSLSELVVDCYDLSQRFHFARLLAQGGDDAARRAMYNSFRPGANCDEAEQFIELDGIKGFLFVAERLADRLADDNEWEDDWLLRMTFEKCGEADTRKAFHEAASLNPRIGTYQSAIERTRQLRDGQEAYRSDPEGMTYEEIRLLIQERGEGARVNLPKWGVHAAEVDLQRAAADLIAEREPRQLRAYLKIFWRRAFPGDHRVLLRLISSHAPNTRIPNFATRALSNLTHSDIRTLAFDKVNIELLANNFEEGDHAIIESWCDAEKDEASLHGLVFEILDFYRKIPNDDAERKLLRILYERDPCANCRENFVERLIVLNGLADSIREECKYDANSDIAALF